MILLVAFLLFVFNANVSYATTTTQNIVNGCTGSLDNDTYSYAMYAPNQHTCANGYYLPAHVDNCVACPSGHTCNGGTFVFNEDKNQGIVYNLSVTQDIEYGCNNQLIPANINNAYAKFEPNEYTCNSGYYLPANSISCAECLRGYTCAGGTYSFNENNNRGILINTYTCSPGYYLPADAIECVKCLENNYCVGGTYTFNPTTDQGITHCSGDLRAPVGMREAEQCGRRLNIGGKYVYSRSTRKTHPSINLDMDLDGTTEFYISLSTTPVPMNADFKNLTEHNKLVIDLPKAYINSAGIYIPAGKYYAYDDTITNATPFETAE